MSHHLRVLLLFSGAALLFAGSAAAQFETPNRQFHDQTTFRLVGRHIGVACEACHIKSVYKGTPSKCFDCHWVRRQDDPFRLQLGSQCEQCHRPASWTAVHFDHAATTGVQLNGAHMGLSCQACHKNHNLRAADSSCISCHQKDYQSARNPNHVTAGFPTTCEPCHHASDTAFSQARFDHQASFPLLGPHAQQACTACHTNGVYHGTARDCVGCHRDAYTRTTSPNHAAAGFPTTCETCHRATDSSFRGVVFNHGAVFALVGLHAQQTCAACHKNNVYRGLSRDCVGCHRGDYDRTTSPAHAAAGFGTTCDTCHRATDSSFKGGGTFNHATTFSLVGLHAQQVCTACHTNGVYRGTPRDCVGCHRAAYDRTTSPAHAAAGFGTTCDTCHRATDSSFKGGGSFSHATTFALVGLHAQQVCTACHTNGVYRGTPRDCVGCHRAAYDHTTSPAHAAAGFGTTCDTCHRATDSSFKGGGSFNHATTFALVGLHAQQVCTACHANGVYRGTPRDCVGCHRANYDRTTSPKHSTAGFSTSCETCHKATDSSFGGGSFNHASTFALVGLHAQQACTACHVNGVYRGTPRDCVGCHRTNYDRTTSPAHAAAGFSTSCETCHKPSDSSFRGASFNHATTFALVGLHAQQACAACHVNGVYRGTPRDCVGCHRTNYDRTTSPAHAAAGFSTACETCHKATDSSFGGGSFNHATTFALVGLHAQQACTTCHTNGVYKGTPRDCVGCHRANYDRTTTPNHAAAGFPTTCDSCHRNTDSTWLQGTFNHSTAFALAGLHAQQPCAACHVNGVYRGTPRTCVGCHRTNYDRTTNPNHTAAGFPTTCETCHRNTDTAWTQGTFSHTRFPITSGRHAVPCAQCHTTGVFQTFNCLGCHTQSQTDPHHQGRNGYRYDSVACYGCHPNGRAG